MTVYYVYLAVIISASFKCQDFLSAAIKCLYCRAGLAYCRHLSTVRTHLSALVNHTIMAPDVPCDAYKGLTADVWQTFLRDCSVSITGTVYGHLSSACPRPILFRPHIHPLIPMMLVPFLSPQSATNGAAGSKVHVCSSSADHFHAPPATEFVSTQNVGTGRHLYVVSSDI